MAADRRDRRPGDRDYYLTDKDGPVAQGDLFCEVPLGYPMPPDAIDHDEGRQKFLAGPFEPGFGLLLTPDASMISASGGYAHPHRALAPVLPLERLVDTGAIGAEVVDQLRVEDALNDYLYLPGIPERSLPESVALLHAPITLHHDYLTDKRVACFSEAAAVHLRYKLAAHVSGRCFRHVDFE